MAAAPIDYDALAQQHGGTAAVDYDALAAQHGGTATSAQQGSQQGALSSFADASGLTGLAHTIAHPIDTLMGLPSAVGGMVQDSVNNVKQGVQDYKQSGLSQQTRRDFGRAIPVVGPALAKAQAQQDAGNTSGMLGTMLGTVAGLAGPKIIKEVAPEVLPVTGRAMQTTGEVAESAGNKIVNKTVGALQSDFKRGANPARGYFASGNGVSLSLRSIADKAADSRALVGKQLGQAYDAATQDGVKIPVDRVQQALGDPLKKAYDLANGPGGTGDISSLENYAEGFRKDFEEARQNGGFTPRQLFQMKRSIADNVSWSDPTQFNLKAVRQQQAGAISGVLSDAIPETADLNQTFMDLTKLASRAKSRAETGSYPLTKVAKLGAAAAALGGSGFAHGGVADATLGMVAPLVADSVPVRTAAATALVRGGQNLSAAGAKLGSLFDRTAAVDDGFANRFTYDPANAYYNAEQKPNQLPPPQLQNLEYLLRQIKRLPGR